MPSSPSVAPSSHVAFYDPRPGGRSEPSAAPMPGIAGWRRHRSKSRTSRCSQVGPSEPGTLNLRQLVRTYLTPLTPKGSNCSQVWGNRKGRMTQIAVVKELSSINTEALNHLKSAAAHIVGVRSSVNRQAMSSKPHGLVPPCRAKADFHDLRLPHLDRPLNCGGEPRPPETEAVIPKP